MKQLFLAFVHCASKPRTMLPVNVITSSGGNSMLGYNRLLLGKKQQSTAVLLLYFIGNLAIYLFNMVKP